MARKTHRPDDILWTVTAVDIETVLSKKNARQKLIGNGQFLFRPSNAHIE